MKSGFSLVELSIVLVILGLLTGGILAGQSLIRAAELRAVTTEYQRYATAIQSFRDKYMAIPGDMSNATRFWSRQAGTGDCVTGSAAAVGTPGTCDGNGSGTLTLAAASQSAEPFQFWRQLALAGLIEGSFSGYAGSGGANHSVAGTNVPPSRISNGAWWTFSSPNYPGDSESYAFDYGNYILIGTSIANTMPLNPLFRPEEAWNIDTKMDDGKPAQGRVIARFWNNTCAAADDGSHANNDLNASYKLTDNSLQCSLFFIKVF